MRTTVVVLVSVLLAAVAQAKKPNVSGNHDVEIGSLEGNQPKYLGAEGVRGRSVEPRINQRVAGTRDRTDPEHTALSRIGELRRAGKLAEATSAAESHVEDARERYGEEHDRYATAIALLADLYRDQGRYARAEPLYKRALLIREKTIETTPISGLLTDLAQLYRLQGRDAEAEPLMTRALELFSSGMVKFVDGQMTIITDGINISYLNNLALLYQDQGTAEAELLYKRTLDLIEKEWGLNHIYLGGVLEGLADLYESETRYAKAEQLQRRAIAITEKALGADHEDMGRLLVHLAWVSQKQGRHAEAETLYKRALPFRDKVRGEEDPLLLLGSLYQEQGRYAEAEPLFRGALERITAKYGTEHPEVGRVADTLAMLYQGQGRYAEAEALFKRALDIFETALGRNHSRVMETLTRLGWNFLLQSDWKTAAAYFKRSTDVLIGRSHAGTEAIGTSTVGKVKSEAERRGYHFRALIKATYRLAEEDKTQAEQALTNMFKIAQWAQASEASASLMQMAARQARGDSDLAHLVRERQDLIGEWQARNKTAVARRYVAFQERNRETEAALSNRLNAINARIAELDRLLAEKFSDYALHADPKPLAITDVQALLSNDEALVLILPTGSAQPVPEESFIWVITRIEARWARSNIGRNALADAVAALRCGLDHTLWLGADSAEKCRHLVHASPAAELVRHGDTNVNVDVLPFDVQHAHHLYRSLLGSFEHLITRKHLLIIGSDALTSLPFHVLVTEPSADVMSTPVERANRAEVGDQHTSQPDIKLRGRGAIPPSLTDYRNVSWLGTRQPITVLPSVGSLKALRQFAKVSRAVKPYLGIGNPLLSDVGPRAEQAKAKQSCAQQPQSSGPVALLPRSHARINFKSLFRGRHADIEILRMWTPLPETADELCAVGRQLSAEDGDILLGARATETTLKALSESKRLADYSILHFATHGALTGQVQGSAEPGLILTPPAWGTADLNLLERDDGFLTASEIATLKLDADWVVLSACNTAGASGESAEALSGMARAFFYAGARALLVSHWEVGSDAAVKLITRAFAELKDKPGMGRAEALRISMRELIETGTLAEAHPSQWAPFVVVGEGAHPKPVIISVPANSGIAAPVAPSVAKSPRAVGAAHLAKAKRGKRLHTGKDRDWKATLWERARN